MSLPQWVTSGTLEEALRSHLGDGSLRVTAVSSEAAVPVGDNYTSDLFRVRVAHRGGGAVSEEVVTPLVVKCCADSGPKELLAREIGLFEKEAIMFNVTLPLVQEALDAVGEPPLTAECLLAASRPRGLLVLQDLRPLGFRMADRRDGLDLEHCRLVVDRLAALHAGSLAVRATRPEATAGLESGIYANRRGNPVIEQFVSSGFRSLAAALSGWPGHARYADKMRALGWPELFERTVAATDRADGDFCVVNHGDTWTNNMLFRYDPDGRPVDMRFVDFQMSVWASPSVDLQYFFHTSPSLDVYSEHRGALLRRYHERLTRTLTGLAAGTAPTFDRLEHDYESRAFYGLAAAASVLPLVRAPRRSDATYDDLVREDDSEGGIRHASYNCDGYRGTLTHLMPLFDKLGLLDP